MLEITNLKEKKKQKKQKKTKKKKVWSVALCELYALRHVLGIKRDQELEKNKN